MPFLPSADDPGMLLVPGELIMPRVIVEPAPPPPPPVMVPVTWLVAQGDAAVLYRTVRDLVRETPPASTWPLVPYGSRMGWNLLGIQDGDGSWSAGMLTVPTGGALNGVGTIPAYRRLLELGWDPESPGMARTRRILFRLLAQDRDPSVLAELRPAGDDEDQVVEARQVLREAAAAALAQAGYESDPRLRGAAQRLVDEVSRGLKRPAGATTGQSTGQSAGQAAGQSARQSAAAGVASSTAVVPSFHLLTMLAYMPLFRHEHAAFLDRVFAELVAAWPDGLGGAAAGTATGAATGTAAGTAAGTTAGSAAGSAAGGPLQEQLAWLELMARLGFLGRHQAWSDLLDALLAQRDARGVWAPSDGSVARRAPAPASWSWPGWSLSEPVGRDRAPGVALDVSFRLALIARLAGRPMEFV